MTNKVKIEECSSFDEARNRAMEEASNSGGSVYPVAIFRQGKRISLAGAIANKQIAKYISLSNNARKGDSPDKVLNEKNRPIMQEHVDSDCRLSQRECR